MRKPPLHFIKTFAILSEKDTEKTAKWIASCLKSQDVLLLQGNLGSGKTTFARFLIRILLQDNGTLVPSPTFPLIVTYDTPLGELWHVDLYRLTSEEVPSLGLEEHWNGKGLTMIEWPERLSHYPSNTLRIHFERRTSDINISFHGSVAWKKRIEKTECPL